MSHSATEPTTVKPAADAQPPRRNWGWLRISLTDVFFVTLILWLFIASPQGWDRLVWDGDVALHTRIGDYILDNGVIPSTDPFSFTAFGARWFAFQWLSGVLFALLNKWAGLKAIVLLCGSIIALSFTVLLRDMIRRGANGLLALLLVLVAATASMIHFHARPHLFTILFLVVAHYLIARDRESPTRKIWLLVPLMVLWVNLHSGFPVLIVSLVILVVGTAIAAYWDSNIPAKAGVRRYGILLAACGGATLLNPNGIRLHLHIWSFLGNDWLMRHVNEYAAPKFRSEAEIYFMVLLIAACAVLWRLASLRQWTDFGWVFVFAVGSLMSARNIPLLLVIALPQIAVALTSVFNSFAKKQSRRSAAVALKELSDRIAQRLAPISVWAPVSVVLIAVMTSASSWPTDLSAQYFPRAMVRDHRQLLAESRVFAPDQWGDYLLWVNYPRQRVFMDGRSDFFAEKIGRDYLTVSNASAGWREVLARYRVDTVLIPPGFALDEFLDLDPSWEKLAEDTDAVLYRKTAVPAPGD